MNLRLSLEYHWSAEKIHSLMKNLSGVRAVMASAGVVIRAVSSVRALGPRGDVALIGILGIVALNIGVGAGSVVGVRGNLGGEHSAKGDDLLEHPAKRKASASIPNKLEAPLLRNLGGKLQ